MGPQPATPPQRRDSSGVPRCPRADRPRAASVRSPARGHNPDRGLAPVFSWGRPPPGALPRRTPTGRNHSRAPSGTSAAAGGLVRGPPPPAPSALTPCRIAAPNRQLRCSGGDSSGVPRCPRADRPRAASVRSPARSHDLDRGPAPVFSWGRPPPGALPRRTPTGRNHSRAPSGTSAATGGGARPGSPAALIRLPSCRVRSRPDARPRPRPHAQASGSRAHQRADFAPRHSLGSPRGPTLARPLPPAQPLRSDLDRPGEGALLDIFSPAPPEREIPACAISGSLATPQNNFTLVNVQNYPIA
ncbi:hypothetical protein NDU88_004483 [Pleurodeles waltl]|uniref:Basic proline-rich protein-like n=1 Tax=Pleurodeles waltl TaxID=8319 RepID=A0AAV7V1J6_PLEWA|nr:hypothetical protein NDU88_004483 [Pleurodeles waltl]